MTRGVEEERVVVEDMLIDADVAELLVNDMGLNAVLTVDQYEEEKKKLFHEQRMKIFRAAEPVSVSPSGSHQVVHEASQLRQREHAQTEAKEDVDVDGSRGKRKHSFLDFSLLSYPGPSIQPPPSSPSQAHPLACRI